MRVFHKIARRSHRTIARGRRKEKKRQEFEKKKKKRKHRIAWNVASTKVVVENVPARERKKERKKERKVGRGRRRSVSTRCPKAEGEELERDRIENAVLI